MTSVSSFIILNQLARTILPSCCPCPRSAGMMQATDDVRALSFKEGLLMGKTNIWWKLQVEDYDDLTDEDREHIAEVIKKGFNAGELIPDEEEAS